MAAGFVSRSICVADVHTASFFSVASMSRKNDPRFAPLAPPDEDVEVDAAGAAAAAAPAPADGAGVSHGIVLRLSSPLRSFTQVGDLSLSLFTLERLWPRPDVEDSH